MVKFYYRVLIVMVLLGLATWYTGDRELEKIFTWAIYNFIVFPLVILAFGALIVMYGIVTSNQGATDEDDSHSEERT